jgi:hypothetical protein
MPGRKLGVELTDLGKRAMSGRNNLGWRVFVAFHQCPSCGVARQVEAERVCHQRGIGRGMFR